MELLSRRRFLVRSAAYGSALYLSLGLARPRARAAAEASAEPAVLTPPQWMTLAAMTARIIPSDDSPGAVEAGCVNFIDKALANEDAEMRPAYSEGLAAVDACARSRHGKAFAELPDAERDALLVSLQDGACSEWNAPMSSSDFFEVLRVHTIMGFLSDPKHGGNRDYTGWKLVGYPGASHHRGGYTAAQMIGDEPITAVWDDET